MLPISDNETVFGSDDFKGVLFVSSLSKQIQRLDILNKCQLHFARKLWKYDKSRAINS
jgi:hypothetical protein